MNHYEINRSPWGNTDGAFEPMVDECVSISSTDRDTTTLLVCVFTDNTADPDTSDFLSSEESQINISCRKCDYPFVKSLKRGARIHRPKTNKNYAVQEVVDDFVMGLVIKAKSI